jgi:excisionase family DNA binding protein
MSKEPPPAASTDRLFLRVEDAARLLGISRSSAYNLANRWIDTQGVEGLPSIRLGRRLLVKRAALERWAESVGS